MTRQRKIDDALTVCRRADALHQRYIVTQGAGRWLQTDGRQYLNSSSNDYLGLSHHPQIICAWQQDAECFGVGSGGSDHVSGCSVAHQALEEDLAQWLGYSRALLSISGFAANQAVVVALMGEDDKTVANRLSHTSLLEAASPSLAVLRRFTHDDPQHLGHLLIVPCPGRRLVVTESMFSIDGDSVPLVEVHAVVKQQGAQLLVDDVHGVGASDEEERGSCFQQQAKPELLIVTLGKGFGVSGAAILCSDNVADYLLQFARRLIYSISISPVQIQVLRVALAVTRSREDDERKEKLAMLIQCLRVGANTTDLTLTHSDSAIQPLIAGDSHKVLQLVQTLRQQGCWVMVIRPPTVPVGTARLRITLTQAHEAQDISNLPEVLHGAGQ